MCFTSAVRVDLYALYRGGFCGLDPSIGILHHKGFFRGKSGQLQRLEIRLGIRFSFGHIVRRHRIIETVLKTVMPQDHQNLFPRGIAYKNPGYGFPAQQLQNLRYAVDNRGQGTESFFIHHIDVLKNIAEQSVRIHAHGFQHYLHGFFRGQVLHGGAFHHHQIEIVFSGQLRNYVIPKP